MLRAVEGADDVRGAVGTVWTAPDNLVQRGQLTALLHHAVERARESVVCSTFNFQRSSVLWEVLAGAARRPELSVRVYLDTGAADRHPVAGAPTTSEMAAAMAGATLLRTRRRNGSLVRSHAKFVSVDHRFLVVTSANFSTSAEQHNVELGLVIDDAVVAQGIEGQMAEFENHLYEVVRRS